MEEKLSRRKRKLTKQDDFIGVYIDPEFKTKIFEWCDEQRISISQFVREAVIAKLKKENNNGSKETT